MFKTLARTVAVVAVACLPFAAVAESKHEHDHDHEAMAKHGGTIAEVGSYDVEVMLTGGNLVLYVYDEHGKDITKKASKGDALFVVDGASKKSSEERRVGKECGRTCRTRWSADT